MTERFVKTAAVALAIISSGEMLMGTRAMYVRGAQSVAIAAQGGAPPVAAAPDLRAVRVNGTVLNYLDVYKGTGEPAGRPVVFVHGSFGTLDDWRDQVRAMADRRRVITYSRRYHVPNAQVDDGHVYSAALHASDLAAFVQALDVTPVDLVGGSYGGLVAIEMTRRHPALVRALVLQEPPATGLLHGSPGAEALADAAEKSRASIRALLEKGDVEGGMRAAFQSFVAENTGQITWERLPPQAQRYFLTQAFSVRREMEAPLRDWLPRLTCGDLTPIAMPVLLIRGARTSDMFNKTMSALHRCLPHAREAVIANAGHCVPCDNPVEFNRVVLEFLQATAAPRGGRGVH